MKKDTKDAQAVLSALSRFCAKDRLSLAEPFRDGAYMVASDGKMAVRYKIPDGMDGFPNEKQNHPHTAAIFNNEESGGQFHLAERHIFALQSLYGDWCKHVAEGVKRNPNDLEEFICPCCKQRLYLVGRWLNEELEDADQYDETIADRGGFVIEMPPGWKVFLKGSMLGKIISCYRSQALGGLFDTKFTMSTSGERLRAKGPWCEMVCALSPYNSDYHHSLGVMELGLESINDLH